MDPCGGKDLHPAPPAAPDGNATPRARRRFALADLLGRLDDAPDAKRMRAR